MSTDQPPPGQPPEDDPFRKKPSEPPPSGSPYGGAQPPPGPPPGDSPYGSGPPPGGAGPYGAPPPPAGGGGGPYGGPPPPGGGSPYGSAPPPPSDPYGGQYGGVDPLAGMPPLADFGKRFLARFIDFLIIAVPLGLIEWATSNRVVIATDNGDSGTEVISKAYSGSGLLWLLISLAAYIGYDTLMVSKSGRTLGKKWLGLRVAMLNDGSVPTTNAALARAAVLWAPFVICCYCLWDIVLIITIVADKPYRQGWHDKAGKTVVVSAAQ
ncbi:RDD family protein [Streptomyces sp. NPDC001691]|uniref:RDD family protein n=1 Tax=unclassified Streptomyces TaxID=2593676 RepID=UPI000DE90407|nr:RDD family protein [Streptomyces sp. SDr-06]RCH68370.1 RDD family protein [Streptomyces sp. SDr-06]